MACFREAFLFSGSEYRESLVPQELVHAVRESRLLSDDHLQRSPPPRVYKRRMRLKTDHPFSQLP